jgi:hypothetical protein
VRRVTAACLAFCACSPDLPPVECTTGMLNLRVYGRVDCADVALYEARIVDVYRARLAWDLPSRVQNWLVRAREADVFGRFEGASGYLVAGQAFCYASTIHIADGDVRKGSLAHELAHAYQNCGADVGCADGELEQHCGWTALDVWGAIEETRKP